MKPSRPPLDDMGSESDLEDSKPTKTGLESDESVSDLTDLSSDHENDPHGGLVSPEDIDTEGNKYNSECEKDSSTEPSDSLGEFIEWEMV